MAWENFLNHTCDIYHIRKVSQDLGYGLTNEDDFFYPDEPDIAGVNCHFHIRTGHYQVSQGLPVNDYSARIKLSLPAGTDVRVNDRIVSGQTGFSYKLELPRAVHNNHHIIVYAHREGELEGGI